MRFEGQRHLPASIEQVREALHDPVVLRRVIPRCQELAAVGPDHFLATLAIQVGPFADTYRGMFTVRDTDTGLCVGVDAHGRRGRLTIDLRTSLSATDAQRTTLGYIADATVGGLVSRVGTSALGVVGGHLTTRFFSDLERVLAKAPRRAGAPV